jgi:hypothetical protein
MCVRTAGIGQVVLGHHGESAHGQLPPARDGAWMCACVLAALIVHPALSPHSACSYGVSTESMSITRVFPDGKLKNMWVGR